MSAAALQQMRSCVTEDQVYEVMAAQLPHVRLSELIRFCRSFRILEYAETMFYTQWMRTHSSAWPKVEVVLLLLASESISGELATNVDAIQQRQVFGSAVLELVLEGDHLEVSQMCARGESLLFNATVMSCLGLKGEPC